MGKLLRSGAGRERATLCRHRAKLGVTEQILGRVGVNGSEWKSDGHRTREIDADLRKMEKAVNQQCIIRGFAQMKGNVLVLCKNCSFSIGLEMHCRAILSYRMNTRKKRTGCHSFNPDRSRAGNPTLLASQYAHIAADLYTASLRLEVSVGARTFPGIVVLSCALSISEAAAQDLDVLRLNFAHVARLAFDQTFDCRFFELLSVARELHEAPCGFLSVELFHEGFVVIVVYEGLGSRFGDLWFGWRVHEIVALREEAVRENLVESAAFAVPVAVELVEVLAHGDARTFPAVHNLMAGGGDHFLDDTHGAAGLDVPNHVDYAVRHVAEFGLL